MLYYIRNTADETGHSFFSETTYSLSLFISTFLASSALLETTGVHEMALRHSRELGPQIYSSHFIA